MLPLKLNMYDIAFFVESRPSFGKYIYVESVSSLNKKGNEKGKKKNGPVGLEPKKKGKKNPMQVAGFEPSPSFEDQI